MRPSPRLVSLYAALLLALCGSSVAAEILIGGRVTAGDQPVAKAKVSLIPLLEAYAKGELRLEAIADAEPIAETAPDADGLFRLDAPGIGFFTVLIELEGRLPREMELSPLPSILATRTSAGGKVSPVLTEPA